jgi:integrase
MNRPFDHLANSFLSWAAVALAPATVAAYRHQLRKFSAAHAGVLVSDMSPATLSGWARTWHEAQAVVRVFAWATHEARLFPTNPLGRVRLPRRKQRHRILTPSQMTSMLRAASPAGRRYLIGLRETFARPQEIRLACWDDLQSENPAVPLTEALAQGGAVLVFHTFKDHGKRKDCSRPRVLLVSRRLGRLLLRLMRDRAGLVGPIFANSRGKPWTKNAVRCLMRRLRSRVGLGADRRGEHVCAYTWRHSLATLAASRGVIDRTLADLLGHVETRTTTRYLHLQTSHLRDAVERMRRK